MGKHKTFFGESAITNKREYIYYLYRLMELSMSMFEWKGLPDTVDARYLEMILFLEGKAIFFNDEDLADDKGGYLGLKFTYNGKLDFYNIPNRRRAYANNGYQRNLTNDDSVIIWNNYLHTNSYPTVELFAKRLWELDRIIDVNAKAQKTPILIQGSEQQQLTLKNLYMQYDGNQPVIFGDKSLDLRSLTVLNTNAPYIADKMYALKTQIWNEALTYLGISNTNFEKRERLISDEVNRSQGGTVASRYSRLTARREACKQINKMFGLDVSCDYREDYQLVGDEENNPTSDNDEQRKGVSDNE